MITPETIEGQISKEATKVAVADTNLDLARFMAEANRAETVAIQNIARCRESGQEPKKLRIKLDISWPESFIRGLVEDYKASGWKRVSYNATDYGLREPQGYWTITIKME